jgi:hypothetical protein
MTMLSLPDSAALKLDLMFEGIRYSDALGRAAVHSMPNFYPYRFMPGERDPTGTGKATIPYLFNLDDGTLVRIKGDGASSWYVSGSLENGYRLRRDGGVTASELPILFEALPDWMQGTTSDGFPMARAGISRHGDMLVVNVAPGCDYFLEKTPDGVSMRCTFCAYGAPDERTAHLGQTARRAALPELTYRRMQETLQAAVAESEIRHIYLVGGSMTDWHEEGARYLELARQVQAVNDRHIPVTCGSGALPDETLQRLHAEELVDAVCFNLEVWSEPLFAAVCPGKHRYVGYHRWLASLESAVDLWGRGRVYSAMVAGVELEPEHGLSWQDAADLAVEGAADLTARGVMPIYSLYWPLGGREHPEYLTRLREYFRHLNVHYRALREAHALRIWDGFMCHRCAYMQLECDIDRGPPDRAAQP